MGLDNIPHRYACERLGTAVKVNINDREGNPILDDATSLPKKRIDCKATQGDGGCPYEISFGKSGLPNGSVTGMLGTDCWYRGKYGNWLIEALDMNEEDYSFYGDNEDGTYKSPQSCTALADAMEKRMQEHGTVTMDDEVIDTQVQYAIWWLRWVANECSGSDAWY